MKLNEYMRTTFPQLALRPPLFYNWGVGIRFELGVDYRYDQIYENCPYMKGVYSRAIAVFQALHASDDELFLVVDVNDFADGKAFKHKLKAFSHYVKTKSMLDKLQQHTIPYVFPEDDDDGVYRTHRFTLRCKPSDFDYIALLKAICNHDMGLKPQISHRVYFININKQTIYHVYDDRGCDVIATSPETIRDLYHRYQDWILDYDRAKIDQVFM